MIKNSCSLSNKFKYSFILNYRAVAEETCGEGGEGGDRDQNKWNWGNMLLA